MESKVIHITNKKFIDKIKKLVDDKEYIRKKIREGKLSEIKSEIRISESL